MRERDVFIEALGVQPADRPAVLEQACQGDAALRAQVERLLAEHDRQESFILDKPPADIDATIDHPQLSERPGTSVGPYKLLQQIGEGGMGVVFMAEQIEPLRRTVAVKIIKPGMDTRQVIARFEAERQALAMMEHPNIAKVLDAGTTASGRPYFVMELVKGVPITQYCDERQLPLRARLELIVPVCQAVQHAHQKGLIHRDIKPSNVLVAEYDDHPAPKVIDFGVAKATAQRLTERTMFTEFGQVIGTLEYMSPEQAKLNQLDIDTRSDIYSLGVLLYELLTGSTPFGHERLSTGAFDEMLRVIREEEPPKPSTRLSSAKGLPSIASMRGMQPMQLHHLVRGELDWIVMKAIEKDRNRRYQTANAFAADIQRYLKNESVAACPPSTSYRLRKFSQRHKVGVVAGLAIALALVLGVAGTTGGMLWAMRERNAARDSASQAKTQAERSDQVARFLEDMLQGIAPQVALGRDTKMLQDIVDKTEQRIGQDLVGQPVVQAELRLTLAQVYYELQLYRETERISRHTLMMASDQIGAESGEVADALLQLGRALMNLRADEEAEAVTRQAIAMQRTVRGEGGTKEATCLSTLSHVLCNRSEASKDRATMLVEAEDAARRALAIRREHYGVNNDDTVWAMLAVSRVLAKKGSVDRAETMIREAHRIRVRLHGEAHPYSAANLQMLGVVLLKGGKIDEAIECHRKALAIQEELEGKGKVSQILTHRALGDDLREQGELHQSEAHYREAVLIAKRSIGEDCKELPSLLAALSRVLTEQGKFEEAKLYAEDAIAICRKHPDQKEQWRHDEALSALEGAPTRFGGPEAIQRIRPGAGQSDVARPD